MTRETITLDKALFDTAVDALRNPSDYRDIPFASGYALAALETAHLLVVGAPAKEFAEPYVPPVDHAA